MITFYIIFDEFSRMFVRAGKGRAMTHNLSAAKHFTSQWSAEQYIKHDEKNLGAMRIKKIERY